MRKSIALIFILIFGNQAVAAEYVVKKGDTLNKIARARPRLIGVDEHFIRMNLEMLAYSPDKPLPKDLIIRHVGGYRTQPGDTPENVEAFTRCHKLAELNNFRLTKTGEFPPGTVLYVDGEVITDGLVTLNQLAERISSLPDLMLATLNWDAEIPEGTRLRYISGLDFQVAKAHLKLLATTGPPEEREKYRNLADRLDEYGWEAIYYTLEGDTFQEEVNNIHFTKILAWVKEFEHQAGFVAAGPHE